MRLGIASKIHLIFYFLNNTLHLRLLDGHIHLSDADWKDIRLMLDSTYPDFTRKLQENFPTLTEKDINFCCLVKINLNLQSLANIYCISGNSVSRRKLRLKEKLGIDKDDSLSKFLSRFT